MSKVPPLLLVAIISAGIGAGVMWIITHGPGSTTRNLIQLGDTDRPASRVGFAVPYESPPTTSPEAEADRGDPAKPSRLTSPPPIVSTTSQAVAAKESDFPIHSASAPERSTVALPSAQASSGTSPNPVPRFVTGSTADDSAEVEVALSYALEAAQPYVKEGYTIREDYWGGTLEQGAKAIQHQLFKGNEYWFWLGSATSATRINVHVYDSKGDLAESEEWQRGNVAAARVIPKTTGTYYIIVSDKVRDSQPSSRRPRVDWAMAYGFR